MRSAGASTLLSVQTVGAFLRGRGLIEARATVEATELGGGVSNVVLDVRADGSRFVVKQSLPRLRVADEWLAKRERVLNEAQALDLLGRLTPGRVPRVIDVDPQELVVTLERAPDGWSDWKGQLLARRVDPLIAGHLGGLLASWHVSTSSAGEIPKGLDDPEAFEQLRVDPFYRTIARRRPEVASIVDGYAASMRSSRRCLVHGDFSPKNVMVPGPAGRPGLWVLDLEVAHIGDPVFDPAFMLAHLALKSVHLPDVAEDLRLCATSFWEAYADSATGEVASPAARVLGHTGCILMARADGKSPAEYLTSSEREIVRVVGRRLAEEPPAAIDEAWRVLDEVAS